MKFKLPLFTIAIIYIILVAASPTAIYDDSNDNGLPLLKLPYGTWRAAKYDEGADVSSCKFALFLLSSFCFFLSLCTVVDGSALNSNHRGF